MWEAVWAGIAVLALFLTDFKFCLMIMVHMAPAEESFIKSSQPGIL